MSHIDPKKEAKLAIDQENRSEHRPFGNVAPWGEPSWYNSLESPYYNQTHKDLRTYVRSYVDKHIYPYALAWEAIGEVPREEALKWAQSGLPFADVPLAYRPKQFHSIAGIPTAQLDTFHFMVLTDEIARIEGGVMVSLGGASVIGVPPIINHGTESQKRKWLPGLFTWETSFCLGITEPTGGSDVGNIRTTAHKTPDGSHYLVSGHKKWITGAPWATHMTTAVRTGGPGFGGISLLVIPLSLPGISIRKIHNSGQNAGGSSWVTLSDVQVPASNLLGTENDGFRLIMTNFNRERMVMAISCNRKARTCLSTALTYAHDRETFGQPLVAHQIIRHKLTDMARYVESHWAWLEQIAYHVQLHGWQNKDVAGRIALAKVHGGRILEMAAREAQQVLGGVGYQKGGFGGAVEQITRDLRMMVVGGGSEEIIGDLAFREEIKRSKQLGSNL